MRLEWLAMVVEGVGFGVATVAASPLVRTVPRRVNANSAGWMMPESIGVDPPGRGTVTVA